MPPRLDKLANALRSTVLAGNHALADSAARAFSEALQRHWETLSPSDRAASSLPSLARELLGWARGMTIVQRAIAAEQLASVQVTLRYQQERLSRVSRSSIQVRA